ncbi:hypothetical protein [Kitasatospora cineracea]|uniref:Uncharacterized protein n=1 Tax=Kitasatospora cineracea TaxID=88074 RepID=A0A8G1UJM9_9ACTN|nr:hypothetical protein [Kitasatospora cineracea]ROR42917.1 hypothetical protein EDD39_1052 [Kitasatospora cineracea]
MPFSHMEILKALQPLPGGVVAGQCQTRRDGQLIVTAELLGSARARQDEWEGVLVRVINPTVGELDVNAFLFSDYGTLPRGLGARVYASTTPGILQGKDLAAAIEEYVALFR